MNLLFGQRCEDVGAAIDLYGIEYDRESDFQFLKSHSNQYNFRPSTGPSYGAAAMEAIDLAKEDGLL